jgi:hypothetical protein
LMGEHIGNDRIHDIRLAVNDDDVLAPDEIEEVRVGDLADKVVRRGNSATLLGTVPPTLTLTLLVGTDETGAPCWAKYAPIIDTSPEPRVVVTTGDSSGTIGAGGVVVVVVGLTGVGGKGSGADCSFCSNS